MVRRNLAFVALVFAVLALLLAGCSQSAPAASPTAAKPAATAAPAGGAAAAANLDEGKAIFDKNCTGCHPGGDKGVGPSLKTTSKDVQGIKTQVRSGKGQMPAFDKNTISDQQLESLAAYVDSLKKK
ncbi:MAG: cytochrome c [Chloroflexi bacterium]|nr:cytochrome c [Chloroflexota bacterium]